MNPTAIAAALERTARAFHDLALAVSEPTAAGPPPPTLTAVTTTVQPGRVCSCGGAVTLQSWTSKAAACRAWKCDRSRPGEDHAFEWAAS